MSEKVTFKYFEGQDAEQFSFYRIPKQLFTVSYFKCLSSDAKILYGLMLDRISLSVKNQWLDEKNRAYIYFSVGEIPDLDNGQGCHDICHERRLGNKAVFKAVQKQVVPSNHIDEDQIIDQFNVFDLFLFRLQDILEYMYHPFGDSSFFGQNQHP